MPILLGMASSHAPNLFQSTFRGWNRAFERWKSIPIPPEYHIETKEEIEERRVPRFMGAFHTLRDQLAEFQPDVLIVVGGDQGEWFDESNKPQVMVYAGERMWGTHNTGASDPEPPLSPPEHYDKFRIELKVDTELAKLLQEGLVKEGIDTALSTKQNPLGRPQTGSPHAFMNPMPHLMPSYDLPIVPVFLVTTERTPAILTGQRCLEIGRAIAKVCEASSKRIAIYGSGGMSHDPGGPRNLWVDEPLDHWFLDQITAGNADALKAMFSFRSENFVSGTGELRTWITVAGAMDYMKRGHHAKVVEYTPARMAQTGVGWVYWPSLAEPAPARRRARVAARV